MPRTKTNTQPKQKPRKSMEAAQWESCNKLRGAVEPAEYKHVVLSLIFLKYAGDCFEQRKQKLIDQGMQKYRNRPPTSLLLRPPRQQPRHGQCSGQLRADLGGVFEETIIRII